jgi:predicted O-methyltransferase YrrM
LSCKIILSIKYARYCFTSRRKIGGCQYQFINNLISGFVNGNNPAGYEKIRLLCRELSTDKTLVNIKDLGAGSLSGDRIFRPAGRFIRQSSVSQKFGRFLSCLVDSLNPAFIIELGTGAGISTMYMAIASPLCRFYSIEGSPEMADFAGRNLERAGIKNVKIIKGSFRDKLPEVLMQVQHPLVVFIDGDHRGEHLIEYYETILPFTSESTVVILDDIRWSGSMEKAWEYIISQKEVSVSIDLFRMGVLLLKKDIKKRHFVVKF